MVNYREAGKRKRSFFETKEQAESFAAFKNAELKRNGVEHAEFPTALRVMAQNAVEAVEAIRQNNHRCGSTLRRASKSEREVMHSN